MQNTKPSIPLSKTALTLSVIATLTCVALSTSVAYAQGQSSFGNRGFLCVKRVGRTADGSNNRGRDAFMNPTPCPKGYFTIDLASLLNSQGTGQVGPQGIPGPQGPRGEPALKGGTITGRLVRCEDDYENSESYEGQEQPSNNPCESLFRFPGGVARFQVVIPGHSFSGITDDQCRFKLSNVPSGSYNLEVMQGWFSAFKTDGLSGVQVSESVTTDVGDIQLCSTEQPA